MKRILLTLLVLLCASTALAQNASAVDSLFARFKKSARFDYNFPREKVYVHFDNSAYLMGDTIWYKAYVTRASTFRPTTLSRVLYVELLNAEGQQMEKQTLLLDSLGTASSAFFLKEYVHAGYYEVRAFTREMVNWGGDACFSRVLPVFGNANLRKEVDRASASDITALAIPRPEDREGGNTLGSPRPYEMTKSKDRLLTFYPEGGGRVSGAAQRIAYKLTDGLGYPLDETVEVYDSLGKLCATSSPDFDGMGDFTLPADFIGGKARVKSADNYYKTDFPLPAPDAPYALTANMDQDGLDVLIAPGSAAAQGERVLALAVFNRENACYFDTVTVGGEPVDLLIPRKALRGGVNRLELFGASGEGLATRLLWSPLTAEDSLRHIVVDVKQNEQAYEPFAPAVVKVALHDKAGRPVRQASVSVAVRDESGNILSNRDGGMGADMLLASEIRGYIHRPDLYFERDDAAHRRMLDLLMRVQGWTANRFGVMSGAEPFDLRQPIEDKLIVRGTVYKDNKRNEPAAGIRLTLRGYRYENDSLKAGNISGDAVTDENGNFAFLSNCNFEGEYLTQFSMRKPGSDKRFWSRLMLDRWFEPRLRPLCSPELELSLYNGHDSAADMQPVQTFEWTDTLSRAITTISHAAEVVARKKYKGFTGNRYTWGGGEKIGQKYTTKYFNIQKEWEHYKDLGGGLIDLFSMLAFLDNHIEYDRYGVMDDTRLVDKVNGENGEGLEGLYKSETATTNTGDAFASTTPNISYRGHTLELIANNREGGNGIAELTIDEIKSLAIVEDNHQVDNITNEEVRTVGQKYKMYIYEVKDKYRTKNRKGVEYRHIDGFTPQRNFYSPNYRMFDLPTDHDIRRTLLWAPNVIVDEHGQANLIFFNNSHDGVTLDITVRGITPLGQFVDWQ